MNADFGPFVFACLVVLTLWLCGEFRRIRRQMRAFNGVLDELEATIEADAQFHRDRFDAIEQRAGLSTLHLITPYHEDGGDDDDLCN